MGSPAKLKRILDFIGELDREEMDRMRGEVRKTQSETVAEISHPIDLSNVSKMKQTSASNSDEVIPEPVKRTRRTKAEMQVEEPETRPDKPLPESDGNGIDLASLKEFVLEKGQAGHAPAIRAKLSEYGVQRTGELDPKHFNSFYVFLQAL